MTSGLNVNWNSTVEKNFCTGTMQTSKSSLFPLNFGKPRKLIYSRTSKTKNTICIFVLHLILCLNKFEFELINWIGCISTRFLFWRMKGKTFRCKPHRTQANDTYASKDDSESFRLISFIYSPKNSQQSSSVDWSDSAHAHGMICVLLGTHNRRCASTKVGVRNHEAH